MGFCHVGPTWTTQLRYFRAFLNLWFAKPMVCMRVTFHENDGNQENDKNDDDNSDSYKPGVERWIAEITETAEFTEIMGIQGANHALEIPNEGPWWSMTWQGFMQFSPPDVFFFSWGRGESIPIIQKPCLMKVNFVWCPSKSRSPWWPKLLKTYAPRRKASAQIAHLRCSFAPPSVRNPQGHI